MVTNGDVDADFNGRPEPFSYSDTLKAIVVMTDGVNTTQRYMDEPFRSGNSFVYVHYYNGSPRISIWGGEGDPESTEPAPPMTVICDGDSGHDEDTWDDFKSTMSEDERDAWEAEWGTDDCYPEGFGSSSYQNKWYWPHTDNWEADPYGGTSAVRLTWPQLWALVPVSYFDSYLSRMGNMSAERSAISAAKKSVTGAEKDQRMSDICDALKARGVVVFSIGLEVTTASGDLLEACATSPSHYFNVTGNELNLAFSAIASSINQLRLMQ